MLVAADPYRPAAVRQLETLGEKLDVPVFFEKNVLPPTTDCFCHWIWRKRWVYHRDNRHRRRSQLDNEINGRAASYKRTGESS